MGPSADARLGGISRKYRLLNEGNEESEERTTYHMGYGSMFACGHARHSYDGLTKRADEIHAEIERNRVTFALQPTAPLRTPWNWTETGNTAHFTSPWRFALQIFRYVFEHKERRPCNDKS